ncbi:FIG01076514: hypothetical protein [hydrothermal vent metagenome]|uniref:3-keto-5-aminohexanoate cleavage enzyme n=1 Tax=hydrothermal vent metagenome TaxID=652676 RepID=A0A3B0TSN4_9ZZZZ
MEQDQPQQTGPKIYVAPNGARLQKKDHSALPITIEEIVATAVSCHKAGAMGIHAHVRNDKGRHVLDAGLYRELLKELALEVPQMEVQITTEAVGRYSPAQQRALVMAVKPKAVSVALCEMLSDNDEAAARRFYFAAKEAGIDLQHIIYKPEEIIELKRLAAQGTIPDGELSLLFVLGRYTSGQQSEPEMLVPFVDTMKTAGLEQNTRFMVCAFGRGETACLIAAARAGGDCRIGFENNLFNANGTMARDNAERVSELVQALKSDLKTS